MTAAADIACRFLCGNNELDVQVLTQNFPGELRTVIYLMAMLID